MTNASVLRHQAGSTMVLALLLGLLLGLSPAATSTLAQAPTSPAPLEEHPLPVAAARPFAIATGADGALWFTSQLNVIWRLAADGRFSQYPVPTPDSQPGYIIAGPDGALWFTERRANKIGRITTDGRITEYPVASAGPGIVVGRDGALWFTRFNDNRLGRITTGGQVSEYAIPTPDSRPLLLAVGPDGSVWFTEQMGNKIGRLRVAGPGMPGTGAGGLTHVPAPASLVLAVALGVLLWATSRGRGDR